MQGVVIPDPVEESLAPAGALRSLGLARDDKIMRYF